MPGLVELRRLRVRRIHREPVFKNETKTDRLATLTIDALKPLHPLRIRRAVDSGFSQPSRSVQFV